MPVGDDLRRDGRMEVVRVGPGADPLAVGLSCPQCHGVPVRPDIDGCHGCEACDYSGTMAGYEKMLWMEKEGMEAWDEYEKTHKDTDFENDIVDAGGGAD